MSPAELLATYRALPPDQREAFLGRADVKAITDPSFTMLFQSRIKELEKQLAPDQIKAADALLATERNKGIPGFFRARIAALEKFLTGARAKATPPAAANRTTGSPAKQSPTTAVQKPTAQTNRMIPEAKPSSNSTAARAQSLPVAQVSDPMPPPYTPAAIAASNPANGITGKYARAAALIRAYDLVAWDEERRTFFRMYCGELSKVSELSYGTLARTEFLKNMEAGKEFLGSSRVIMTRHLAEFDKIAAYDFGALAKFVLDYDALKTPEKRKDFARKNGGPFLKVPKIDMTPLRSSMYGGLDLIADSYAKEAYAAFVDAWQDVTNVKFPFRSTK